LRSPAGRGIPDISAQAIDYQIVFRQFPRIVSGTSAATPVRLTPLTRRTTVRCPSANILLTTSIQTAAGIIALLNDFLISEGKKPLGFLNPFLYAEGRSGLNDIKSGSNPGCGTKGFPAIPGWDAVCVFRLLILKFG